MLCRVIFVFVALTCGGNGSTINYFSQHQFNNFCLKNMSYIIPVCFVFPIQNIVPQMQEIDNSKCGQIFMQFSQTSPQIFQQKSQKKYFEIFREYLQKRNKKTSKKVWQKEQDKILLEMALKEISWQQISQMISETSPKICKRRYERIKETSVRWPQQLDVLIRNLGEVYNYDWPMIHKILYSSQPISYPKHSIKQIKERFLLNLRPGIMNQQWTVQQDLALLRIIKGKGTQWRKLSLQFHGRTELQLKNRYYGTLRPLEKKVIRKMNMQEKRLN